MEDKNLESKSNINMLSINEYFQNCIINNFNNYISDNQINIYKNMEINKKRLIYSELIFQYFYDIFTLEDYDKAIKALFFGENTEEKTKAINAYYNLIKGIKLESKEKLILIENDNQLNIGIHLYYIKDYNNNPMILIDCVGFGNTKNKENDDKLIKAFENLFDKLIKQINLVCLIIKEKVGAINIIDRYIIGCITSLFSEEILNNFIFLITNIDECNIKQKPLISNTLFNDIYYEYIKFKMDKKWFYSINSDSILNNDINNLSKYSYEQLNKLNEKIKYIIPISTDNSLELIENRLEVQFYMNNIISKFNIINSENNKIINLDNNINIYNNKIEEINNEINTKNDLIEENITLENKLNNELSELEQEHNNTIDYLDNQYETVKKRKLESSSYKHTICNYCEKNCHNYCDCLRFGRCRTFPLFEDFCEECGHSKSSHDIRIKYHYVDKEIKQKINNDYQIREENDKYYWKKNEINNELYNKRNNKEQLQKEVNDLNGKRSCLKNDKEPYVNERNKIFNGMKEINEDVSEMINKLIEIENKIEKNALNKFQVEIENDYIDYLINEIRKKDNNHDNTIEKLIKRKQINVVYQNISSDYYYLFGFKYISKLNI